MMSRQILAVVFLALLVGCDQFAGFDQSTETKEFRTAFVEERNIVVVVESAGVIQPLRTIEVKSKASGEILSMHAETGDFVEEGSLLVQIDKRVPRNQLALVKSQREAALARRAIADAQFKRAERLFKSHSINEVEYEKTVLERANSQAGVVNSQVAIENARFALDDTEVKSPISGTVIEKLVEKGQVISSPTMDVGGGTVLMKMADLGTVQVQALVNEIDIGKIRRGQQVMVTVTSYSDQPFRGEVLKIEPQALPEHTVTAFPVLIMLENDGGLLRPGMNADVEILIEKRHEVVAVPTAALRTMRDIEITANLIGLDEIDLRERLEQRDRNPASNALDAGQSFDDENGPTARSDNRPADSDVDANSAVGFSGLRNRYWVLVAVNETIHPVYVEIGITDLDYSEVIDGLEVGTEVLLLPSSGLVRTQQRFQQQLTRLARLTGISRRKD